MRLALVGSWPPPLGGVSVHVAAIARALEARGADVVVLDVGERARRGPGVRPARGPARLAAALARVAGEGRLVHVHTSGANAKSWLVALAAGRLRGPGAPRVLTIHSGRCPGWLAGSAARRALAAAACAGFARVLAVSEAIAAALASAGVPPRSLAVLPAFSPALLEARRAPPPALAAFRAARRPLFAAALAPGPTYGADVLLPAFETVRARLPAAGLVLFGAGTAALSRPGAGVLGLGEVEHGAALAVTEAADVFVRPTRSDGDALSVREALALGRAVVASAAGHRPEGCLLVPPGDAAALAVRLAEAAAAPRPAVRVGPDALEALLALYASLAPPRPLPDGGRRVVRASTF